MSVLVDRLSGMEGLMKELAQAQVANTAVLQQIGGRLGSSPVYEPLAQHPCPASHTHSGRCSLERFTNPSSVPIAAQLAELPTDSLVEAVTTGT